MSTKKQKFVYIFALDLSFAPGMLTMSGCAYFPQEKAAGICQPKNGLFFIRN